MREPISEGDRGSRTPKIALMVGFQLVVTLLILEVALRLIRPHSAALNNLLYLPSVNTDFSNAYSTAELLSKSPIGFAPGVAGRGFVLNSRGLRTHEYDARRAPRGIRIVAIGDSFTWGVVPHRHTWPVRLQAMLRNRLRRKDVEVISLGVPGTGPRFYLRMWELEGRRLRPDLVVVGFFIGNDLSDHTGAATEWAHHGWLVEHSMTIRSIRNFTRTARSGLWKNGGNENDEYEKMTTTGRLGYEVAGYADTFDPSNHIFTDRVFTEIEWRRMAICLKENRPFLRELLRRSWPVLEEFDRSVRDTGAELLVFLIPDEYQVDDELSARLLERNGVDPFRFSRRIPQQKLVEFLTEGDIHHIDALQRFRVRSRVEDLYLLRNTHWNRAGNQLAAKMMVDYLSQSDLLPVANSGF